MSLFCGDTCKCKRRCEAGFPNDRALMEGCRDVCRSGDTDITPQRYMDEYLSSAAFLQNSGYDPNLFDDTDLCSLPGSQLDPQCQPAPEPANYTPFILAGVALVVVLVVVLIRK